METFVRRLFTDAEYRKEFLASPAEFIARSGLKRDEQDAALRLSGHMEAALTAPRAGVLSFETLFWD